MNFEQHDIEKSKSHLLDLINKKDINLEVDKIDSFVYFIINNYLLLESYKIIKDSIWETLKTINLKDIRVLQERFIKEEDNFDRLISKSFQIEKRGQLKNKLTEIDKEIEEDFFDETITKSFQIEKREELKQKLKALDVEPLSKKGKVFSMRPYLKSISIAASIILALAIWQPQHSSDKKLFSDYINNLDKNSINDFTQVERIKDQQDLRGEEEHFRNYTYYETLQLLEAIALVKRKDFEKAKEVFNRLHVEKEKNPGLSLYLSIAQLNTDNLEDAIGILEYLVKLNNFSYQDETKFHLSYAYLKLGKRKKAKILLNELVQGNSKFADQAQKTLKKIRWF